MHIGFGDQNANYKNLYNLQLMNSGRPSNYLLLALVKIVMVMV